MFNDMSDYTDYGHPPKCDWSGCHGCPVGESEKKSFLWDFVKVCLGIAAAFVLFGFLASTVKAESIDNQILLQVAKVSDIEYRLDWADLRIPLPNPQVYKVYRSEDPTILGVKIATVNGTTYNDVVANPDVPAVYYYQIVRLTE